MELRTFIILQLYLNYRPYMKDMLAELKQDFELILFASNYEKYVQKIAGAIQKEEQYFDFIISKDNLFYNQEIDFHVIDLNVLLGQRDVKDIIVVSNTCGRYMFHTYNGIPVKEF